MIMAPSERCQYRQPHEGDADWMLDMYSRADMVRYIGGQTIESQADITARLARLQLLTERPGFGFWLAELSGPQAQDPSAETRVGFAAVKHIPISEHVVDRDGLVDVEIGWHVHPHVWRQGFGTEFGRAAIAHASALGIPRIVAVTHVDNIGSQRVCRAIGMDQVGVTDVYYDQPSMLFSMSLR